MERNQSIDIAKGIAIILVVLGHAEFPYTLLNRAIYLFHMPLFFITAGYFFSPASVVKDPWRFVVKRFKGLYIPFVKWSLFFLLIHNLLHGIGILNEVYGNWENGVTHPYTLHDFMQRGISIIFSMSGYDEFLGGAFWFFRGLLVASILFMVGWLLLNNVTRLRGRAEVSAAIVCVAALLLGVAMNAEGLRINTITQGGYRDIMGVFFFGLGFLYHQYEERIGHSMWWALAGLVTILVAAWFGCGGMNPSVRVRDVFTLVLTGTAGWVMTYNLSCLLSRQHPRVWEWLARLGTLSLYIFIWHVSAYKVVSLLKIWWYDLDPLQIGCHMVVHHNSANDIFWLLYTIVGVGLPVAGRYLWQSLKRPLRPAPQP